MFKEIKILGKESVVYGISTVFGRLLNIILIPLYTYYLSPDSYGIVATLFSFIAFLNVIYGLGLNHGYMRFFKENLSLSLTITIVFFSSFVFSFLIILFAKPLSILFQIGQDNFKLVIYSAIILYFDSLAIIPLTDLRMKHRVYSFVFIKVFSIIFNVILNFIFLKYMHIGIEGIFIANIISSFSQMLLLFDYLKYVNFKIDKSLLKEIFSYSLPYIPSSLSSVIIQLVDRPIMMMLLNSYIVGIYQANFRLSIFMNLIISMFDFAWRPFVMERFEKENSKEIFKKVFEYFAAIVLFIWLFLSLFIEDLVKISVCGVYFINPNYWSGLGIVPVIMLAYFFNGLYINFMIGTMVERKTKYIMYANITAAILTIFLNFILVPEFKIYGAAYSVLFSYIFLATYMYFINKKIYYIAYNIKKLLMLLSFTILAYVSKNLIYEVNPCVYQQYKIFLIMIYPFCLMAFYFSKEERNKILNIFKNIT